MAENGMRRADQENIISGRAVIGPQASSQRAGARPAVKWPSPRLSSQPIRRTPGRARIRHSTKRPVCASAATRLRMIP